MIKRFCDLCGAEITGENRVVDDGSMGGNRMTAEIKRGAAHIKVEVLQTLNGTANTGDVCKYCILDALYQLDDRTAKAVQL